MVSIVEFSPARGPVGEPVKIFGTEFSPTPSLNRVTFARAGARTGAQAPVISSTTTTIVTRVPPVAATGPITVAAPGGSATSTSFFTVTLSEVAPERPGAPAIVEIAPVVAAPGTEVVVTGRHFESTPTQNRVTFNGAAHGVVRAASATALSVVVPAGAGSGPVTVETAAGVAASTKDVFIPPPPLTTADVAWTGRLGPDRPVTLDLRRPATMAFTLAALVLFDGVIGRRATLIVTGMTCPAAEVSVLNPDATVLLRPVGIRRHDGSTFRVPPFTSTGTHTILIDARGLGTGSVTLAIARSD